MTKYFYVRVSSGEQKVMGISIDAQIARAKQIGIEEENICCDKGKSGGVAEDKVEYKLDTRYFRTIIDISNRPELQKLMNKLTKGDIIYFTKWDRLSRSLLFVNAFIEWCQRKEVTLEPLDDSKDRLTRNILIIVAEEELHKTTQRNESVAEYYYNQGLHAYRAPYGYYKNIKGKAGKLKYPNEPEGILIINEKEAEIVRQIYELIKTHTQQEVSEILHMHPTAIHNIIKNPIYKGYVCYKKEKKKGIHKAIIEETS